MSSGGARARSGQPPDPNALRRERDAGDWITLPVEGRDGDPPKLPLPAPTAREKAFWAELWATPQATQWERLGLVREVALYVRRYGESEKRNAPSVVTTSVRQLAESLGLSMPGMARNRWRIGVVVPPAEAESGPRRESVRDRLTVLDGGGGGA